MRNERNSSKNWNVLFFRLRSLYINHNWIGLVASMTWEKSFSEIVKEAGWEESEPWCSQCDGTIKEDHNCLEEVIKQRDSLQSERDRLKQAAITFQARVRESCAELNPNNYNAESALWKADTELEKALGPQS